MMQSEGKKILTDMISFSFKMFSLLIHEFNILFWRKLSVKWILLNFSS